MKKLILFMLMISLFLSGCSDKTKNRDVLSKVQEENKIVVGVKYDSKPFGFIDKDNQLKGFDIDIAKGIAKRILGDENSVEFKQVTPSNRILKLSSGEIDMIVATMTISQSRMELVEFTQPYYKIGQAVLVKKNSDIYSTKDLNKRRVAIILGSVSEKQLRLLAPDAKIKGYKTYSEAYSALLKGEADAISSDDSILYGFLYDNKSLRILPERYTKENYAIAYRKDEKSKKFGEKVEEALLDMQKRGEIIQIKRKWIR